MDFSTLLAFAMAFFIFAASPGPDNMTIVARTISHGPSSGIAYGAGTVVGILVFLTLAALGLSIIAAKMGVAMAILRYAGAAYLIWMGIRLWTAEPIVPALQPVSQRRGLLKIFATGVALNLGNPKMPLFYIALLPNIVGALAHPGSLGRARSRNSCCGSGGDRRPCDPRRARATGAQNARRCAQCKPHSRRGDGRSGCGCRCDTLDRETFDFASVAENGVTPTRLYSTFLSSLSARATEPKAKAAAITQVVALRPDRVVSSS